ncbi:ATPase PAAT [Scleropages formosus]|uniref:Si:rp71-19m20.1 n=1 Tax=Scleropages formosus TaxID=113540 RepID=A0A8C9RAC5_SCLFO|nr:uncharacterized protein C10orf88 homolog [Scleropages formosus]
MEGDGVRKDELFTGVSSWVCQPPGRQITQIICAAPLNSTSDLPQLNSEIWGETDLMYLERGEETSPCLLRLEPGPNCAALIVGVMVISEARTMEVYSGSGEYLGTCRGEADSALYFSRVSEGHPFYKKHLKFESPTTSCEVKLLSLGGRARVGIGRIALGLQAADITGSPPATGPGIDLQCVQSLVDSMGATLSPGAQSLMDMVQFQQKNKMDVLGGFLPLLMGGGPLASLTKGAVASQMDVGIERHTYASQPNAEPASQGIMRNVVSTAKPEAGHGPPSQPLPPSSINSSDHKLTGFLASLLNGHPGQKSCSLGPDMLPVLHKVCGEVAELRIENVGSKSDTSAEQQQEHRCCRVLEEVMERRIAEMEKRLMQHIDQRLETLQQNLQHTLLAALPPSVQGAFHREPCRGPTLLNGES